MASEKSKLKHISGTIKSAMHEMWSRGKTDRDGWIVVGSALWDARNEFQNPADFGAWIKAEGIDQIPGLARAPSRSDCIWLFERPLCAGLVPVEVSHPRGVRAAWRAILAKTAADWVAADVMGFEDMVKAVMTDTHATQEEAEGAVGLATTKALPPHQKPEFPVAPVDSLLRALRKAKKAGFTPVQVVAQADAVWLEGHFWWSLEPIPPSMPHPWTPPLEADTPAARLDHAIRMALVEGLPPLEIDAKVNEVVHFNYAEAFKRAHTALKVAKSKGFDIEEAKTMIREAYLGDL